MTDWSEHLEDASELTRRSSRDRGNVVQALERLEHSERDAIDNLRVAICAFVGSLRSEGATQDEVIEAVRTLVATPATADGDINLAPAVREALVELAVHWCTDEWTSAKRSDPRSR